MMMRLSKKKNPNDNNVSHMDQIGVWDDHLLLAEKEAIVKERDDAVDALAICKVQVKSAINEITAA